MFSAHILMSLECSHCPSMPLCNGPEFGPDNLASCALQSTGVRGASQHEAPDGIKVGK